MQRPVWKVVTCLLFLTTTFGLIGCSKSSNIPSSNTPANTATDFRSQQVASTTASVAKFLTSYGWVLRAKVPAIQNVTLTPALWNDPYGEGPIWKFNETLSASIGLPFHELVGKTIQLWSYSVKSEKIKDDIDRNACAVIYGGEIHGLWLASSAFNVAGYPINQVVPNSLKDFTTWMQKEDLVDLSSPTLSSLKGKTASDTVRLFFHLSAKGDTLSAIRLVAPLSRWVDTRENPRSYWNNFFANHKFEVKSVDTLPPLQTYPPNQPPVDQSALGYVIAGRQTVSVEFSNGTHLFISLIKESKSYPWFIEAISNKYV